MKTNVYELTYTYYQYNSGACDNGNYTKTLVYKESQAKECFKLYKQFLASIDSTLNEEENNELQSNYIAYAGYFEAVTLKRVVREEFVLSPDSLMYE